MRSSITNQREGTLTLAASRKGVGSKADDLPFCEIYILRIIRRMRIWVYAFGKRHLKKKGQMSENWDRFHLSWSKCCVALVIQGLTRKLQSGVGWTSKSRQVQNKPPESSFPKGFVDALRCLQ